MELVGLGERRIERDGRGVEPAERVPAEVAHDGRLDGDHGMGLEHVVGDQRVVSEHREADGLMVRCGAKSITVLLESTITNSFRFISLPLRDRKSVVG